MSESPSLMTEATIELVAIGAAIVANCEPCFRHHFDLGRKLGVAKEDMRHAVKVALSVKDTPHRKVLETAEKYLAEDGQESPQAPSPCACSAGSCC